MNTVEVCLTPDLIHQFDLRGKIVVVVDIFRATSCMVTGMAYGVEAIYPVDNVETCFGLGKKGMLMAGERDGVKVEGFTIGNSPFEYMQEEFRGRSVAVTTTNGTRAILASTEADQVLIGAFLNLNTLASYIASIQQDVVIHCAGWKGTVNIEDTLFAGALIKEIAETRQIEGDPALLAFQLFEQNKNDLMKIAMASSHAKRLKAFGIEKDLKFCMGMSVYSVLPEFRGGQLQPLS